VQDVFSQLSTEELLHKLEELGDRAPMELIQAILAKSKEVVGPLSRILQDKQYWEAQGDKLWMPTHAVKLLGTLADPEALPQLIDALVLAEKTDDEWVMDDLPTVFGRIGPPAVESLIGFINAHRGYYSMWWSRSVAANGLASIAIQHTQERERILSFLHGLFSEDEDTEFMGSIACDLLDLHDSSSFPVLEDAFNRDLIDKYIISREDFLEEREEPPDEKALVHYKTDLLEFYVPEEVARRQERWEEERKEREQLAAQKRESREKSISIELKRLEITIKLIESKVLPLSRKVGRNEPCPCGSGKKFKKCHLPLVESTPPKSELDRSRYVDFEYLQRASPYDPLFVLESLTALAFEAEREGDAARAMEIFRKLEPVAEHTGEMGDFLREWEIIGYNHPELGDDGLAVIRRLQSFYKDKDREQWTYATMDLADYLDFLGRRDEGKNEYERLLREVPNHPLIHIRYADFLEKGGNIDEAIHHYKQVLQMEDQADREDLGTAAEELKELASHHGIELDTRTQEAIRRWSYGADEENTLDEL
jgi:tetratricopeptide (TPR) repeat protein